MADLPAASRAAMQASRCPMAPTSASSRSAQARKKCHTVEESAVRACWARDARTHRVNHIQLGRARRFIGVWKLTWGAFVSGRSVLNAHHAPIRISFALLAHLRALDSGGTGVIK